MLTTGQFVIQKLLCNNPVFLNMFYPTKKETIYLEYSSA